MKPKRPYKDKIRYFSSVRKVSATGYSDGGLFTKAGKRYYIEYNSTWPSPREYKHSHVNLGLLEDWKSGSYKWTEITKEEYEHILFTLCL